MLTLWQRIKMDMRERFLNYETAKGVYLVPAGLATIYVSLYHIQFLFQTVGCLFGWYLVSEGLRKILVNRIKQATSREELVKNRKDADDERA